MGLLSLYVLARMSRAVHKSIQGENMGGFLKKKKKLKLPKYKVPKGFGKFKKKKKLKL